MEAKKQAAGEEDLSMEEILQSIRRIIADDGEEVAAADAPATPAAPPASATPATAAAASVSDILELTDMLEEDGSITKWDEQTPATASPVEAAPAPAPAPKATDDFASALSFEPIGSAEEAAQQEPKEDWETLLSKQAEAAALSSLNKLKTPETPTVHPHTPSPVFRSGTTVEDMVTDMLRPMMKNWLDENLPGIVERIVEREVHRLTRR